MYFPCFECLNRYNREYTEECDEICMYAKAIKEKDTVIQGYREIVKMLLKDIRKLKGNY